MSNENNPLFANEDNTQTLNKMAADIRSLTSEVNLIKAELAKKTNPDLMSAFAQMLRDALEEQKVALKTELKAEFDHMLGNALAQQKAELKAEFDHMLGNALAQQKAELKAEFDHMLGNALAQQKAELKAEFDHMLGNALAQQKAEFDQILRKELEPIKEAVNKVETRMGNLEKEMASLRIAFRGSFTDFVFMQDKLETRLNKLEESRT